MENFKYILCIDKNVPLDVEPNFKLILEKELNNPSNDRFVPAEGLDNVFYLVEDLTDKKLTWVSENEVLNNSSKYQLLDESSLNSWIQGSGMVKVSYEMPIKSKEPPTVPATKVPSRVRRIIRSRVFPPPPPTKIGSERPPVKIGSRSWWKK